MIDGNIAAEKNELRKRNSEYRSRFGVLEFQQRSERDEREKYIDP